MTDAEIARGLSAEERALIIDGRTGYLAFVKTPGLVERVWSPFGGCYRHYLTDLGEAVAHELKSENHGTN